MKKSVPIFFFGFLTLLGLGFVVIPAPLKPVYVAWQKVAYVLGRVVTIFVLILVYYLIITPVALIKRSS